LRSAHARARRSAVTVPPAQCSLSFLSPSAPHLRADLAERHTCALSVGKRAHRFLCSAEACATPLSPIASPEESCSCHRPIDPTDSPISGAFTRTEIVRFIIWWPTWGGSASKASAGSSVHSSPFSDTKADQIPLETKGTIPSASGAIGKRRTPSKFTLNNSTTNHKQFHSNCIIFRHPYSTQRLRQPRRNPLTNPSILISQSNRSSASAGATKLRHKVQYLRSSLVRFGRQLRPEYSNSGCH
jgi:hypothetical protein